ncbi:MAG: response regulator, partial [Desulfobacteraceae bacterium]|nr:response regulator [Desulfobacteraceae bacterium]
LNGVLGLASLLVRTNLSEDQRDLAETLCTSGETLLRVINDVLDFSKIEAGKLVLDSMDFDLNDLLAETAKVFAGQARQKGLELVCVTMCQGPVPVQGDPGRLKQILYNLLSNAIKFTDRGKVTLEARISSEEDETSVLWEFQVRDTGIGITPEARQYIFESFFQGDATTAKRYGGTGLGLSICRELSHLMQGDIAVSSEPGRGSCFTFTARLGKRQAVYVPATVALHIDYEVQSTAAKHSSRSDKPIECKYILLAEDNEINQKVAKQMLERLGCRVDIAENGLEVLDAVTARSYDLILMDCQMPELDGYETTRQIRQRESSAQTGHIPIIALTGFAMHGDREICLQAGMDDYLSKPFSLDELRVMIKKWPPTDEG